MFKDFSNIIYLTTTLGGTVAILEVEVEDSIKYVRADAVTSLLSKAYQSGLDNRNSFKDLSSLEKK